MERVRLARPQQSQWQTLQEEAAVKAAQSVQGVRKVVNAIKVEPGLQTERETLLKEGVQLVP